MKTIRNWLDQLKEPERTNALSNMRPAGMNEKECSMIDALNLAFCWGSSPQGLRYWAKISKELHNGTYYDAPQLTPETCKARAKESMHGLPDTGGRSEFSTGAVRDASEGKGFPSHLPTRALLRASRRFEDGAAKYDAHNWRKGIPLSRYVDSMNRHTWLFMQGDTSEDHLGAISWNALCLSETFDLISEGKLPESLNDLPEHQQ
jgi:hypothetical protein